MRLNYDVLVVGAGPSGSTAARFAAKAGCKTLLIEKRAEIGTPVRCGEGVARRWLEEVGLRPSKEFIAHEVEGARVLGPDGSMFVVDESHAGNEVGYVLERDLFDRYLAKQAAKAGADTMIRTSAEGLVIEKGMVRGAICRHMDEEFEVRAPVVIGADGFESQVGTWAGIDTRLRPKDVDSCLQYTLVGLDGDPRFNDFYLGSLAPGGYVWVFWKGDDMANVGIGANLSLIKDKAQAKVLLDRFIASHPGIAKGKVLEEVAGAVSVSPPLERTVAYGLMLVGDAARLIDPLTGGGILNACLSGMYAGMIAREALDAEDFSEQFLNRYDKRWRERLESQLYRNYMVKERLLTMKDEMISRIIRTLSECDLSRMTTLDILRALRSKDPELVKEFEGYV